MEFIGFSARAAATDRTDELLPYAIQSVFILIAPALYAASVYMALSRLMRRLHAEHLSIVPTKWLTKIFVLGDVLSFLIQTGGGGLASTGGNSHIDPNIPKYIILVGLFVQVIVFGLFIVTIIFFHRRKSHEEKNTKAGYYGSVNWKRIVIMLYVISAMIMLRSIYRIIEYAMGMDSYFFAHEWPTYVLDGVPMLVTMFIWGFYYPSELSRYAIIDNSDVDIPLCEPTGQQQPLAPPYYSNGPPPAEASYYSAGPPPVDTAYYSSGSPPPSAPYYPTRPPPPSVPYA